MHDMAIWWATMLQKAILCLKLQSNTTTINLETMKMYSKWTIRYPLSTLGQLIRCKSYLAPVSFSFLFYKNVVFPAQPKYSYISCRFHAESILVLYSLIEFKQKNYHDTFQFGGSFPLCCNSILYIFLTSSCAIHQTVISMNIWPYWLVQVFLFCWLVLPVGLSSSVKWK